MQIKMDLFTIPENNRRWLIFTLITLTLATAWTFVSRASNTPAQIAESQPVAREGFTAPDMTLELLDGRQVTLSDLRGKVVLVNLWATWCPPCRAEMPAIEKTYQTFKSQGVEVLAVNATTQDSESAVTAFIKDNALTFPVALDRSGEVSNRYALSGLPSSFFIDRKGIIRAVVVGGPMSEALIQSKIETLLKEEE